MDKSTVYSKTAKGLAEIKTGVKNLTREQARVLMMVDGKSGIGELAALLGGLTEDSVRELLQTLSRLGLVRVFAVGGVGATSGHAAEAVSPDAAPSSNSLPVIEVTELSPQESVAAWAEAKRGAKLLEKTGFYSHGVRATPARAKEALHVLVVEDDEALVKLLEVLLTNKGFSVQKCADISAALTALAQGPAPDLVLLDVMLPGLEGKDGFHVLKHIRTDKSLHAVPVIMVTSQVTDDYVMQGLKAGADGYIFKPFKWDTLYKSIESVIGAS